MAYFKRVMIYPYNVASRSARILKDALNDKGIPTKLIRKDNSNYVPREGDLVINWGNSKDQLWNSKGRHELSRYYMINSPAYVATAINKAKAFHHFARTDITFPQTFFDFDELQHFMILHEEEKFDVIVREKLTGHGGEGAFYVPFEEIPNIINNYNPKLITRYIPKKYEYRIHVAGGVPILIQQKKRDMSIPEDKVNWKVRNNANGFIFAVDDIVQPSAETLRMACKAVRKLGLEFGAVDMVYNEYHDTSYVLEVNTACGLEGDSSRRAYAEYFANIVEHGRLGDFSEEAPAAPPNMLSDEDTATLQQAVARFQQSPPKRHPPEVVIDDFDVAEVEVREAQVIPTPRRREVTFENLYRALNRGE